MTRIFVTSILLQRFYETHPDTVYVVVHQKYPVRYCSTPQQISYPILQYTTTSTRSDTAVHHKYLVLYCSTPQQMCGLTLVYNKYRVCVCSTQQILGLILQYTTKMSDLILQYTTTHIGFVTVVHHNKWGLTNQRQEAKRSHKFGQKLIKIVRKKRIIFLFFIKCCVCICIFVYIKILLCVNIGLTGKIEENISIKIIQICMHYDHIWLHLLKDLN